MYVGSLMEEGCLRGQFVVGAKWEVVRLELAFTTIYLTLIGYICVLKIGKRGTHGYIDAFDLPVCAH